MVKKKVRGRSKARYKPLPPHTWEKHLAPNLGGISKPLMIGLIALVLVLLLSLFLLFQDELAGKAFATGQPSIGLGGTDADRTFVEGVNFNVPVMANLGLGKETVALGFEINLPTRLTCANFLSPPFGGTGLNLNLPGVVINENECVNDVLRFRWATLNAEKAVPDVPNVDVTLTALQFRENVPVGTYNIQLSNVEIIDFSNHQDLGIDDGTGTEIIVEPQVQCGDGIVNGVEDCDGTNLDGATCQSEGYDGGSLSCNTDCTFNTNSCTSVTDDDQDGVVAGDDCDDSNAQVGECTGVNVCINSVCVADTDGDDIADNADNCPNDYNPGQEDIDQDGEGDACEVITCTDSDGGRILNIAGTVSSTGPTGGAEDTDICRTGQEIIDDFVADGETPPTLVPADEYLVEFTCDATNVLDVEYVTCANGCLNGFCIEPSDSCRSNAECTTGDLNVCNTVANPNVCVECLTATDCDSDGICNNNVCEAGPSFLDGCEELPNRLDSCQPYSCQFTHILTGDSLNRDIVGLTNNLCEYTEEMPNNGRMDCQYTEEFREVVAQYYRDVDVATTVGTSGSFDLGSGEGTFTYTINGVEVENPLQEALDTGVCVIYDSCTTNADCSAGETCNNNVCEALDCQTTDTCAEGDACNNDNDCAGDLFCNDNDECMVATATELVCNDNLDNDNDGVEDCDDSDCVDNAICVSGGVDTTFSVLITATEDTPELKAYTVLRDTDGKILVFKTEIVPVLGDGDTYTVTANYELPSQVATKEVYVQDALPETPWTVHAGLIVTLTDGSEERTTPAGITLTNR
jgi:hypothetical protein